MRILIALLLCVPSAYAHPSDKAVHALASYAVTTTVYARLRDKGVSKLWSTCAGALVSLAAGATKEYVFDKQSDDKDMLANGAGVALSVVVLNF